MGWKSLRFFIHVIALGFIKCKLPQPMLYSYNLGSYWIHSLIKNICLLQWKEEEPGPKPTGDREVAGGGNDVICDVMCSLCPRVTLAISCLLCSFIWSLKILHCVRCRIVLLEIMLYIRTKSLCFLLFYSPIYIMIHLPVWFASDHFLYKLNL